MQSVINRPCCPPLAKITALQLHILNITSSVSGTWSRALASLWGTPVVKSCPWRSVELAVWWKMVPRSATTSRSTPWSTCPRRCATWTLRKRAVSSRSLCLAWTLSVSAPACPRRFVSWSSRLAAYRRSRWGQSGAWMRRKRGVRQGTLPLEEASTSLSIRTTATKSPRSPHTRQTSILPTFWSNWRDCEDKWDSETQI